MQCRPADLESWAGQGEGLLQYCRGAEEAAALAGVLARLQKLTRLKLNLWQNDQLGRGPQSRGAWS